MSDKEIQVMVAHSTTVRARDLAQSLIDAGPERFADFWFAFAEIVRRDRIDLIPYGKAMSPPLGSLRQEPLLNICRIMEAESYKSSYQNTP